MRLSRMSFVFLCAAVFAGPAISEVKTFGNAVNMAKVPGVELTTGQRKALKNYSRKKAYFGAFYVVPGTDNFFWTRNFHNLDTAKAAAKKGCEIVSEGKACKLYALLYPKGTDPNATQLGGLSQRTAKDFNTRYPKRQKNGKFGAFAINGANGYGVSFGWPNAAEANEAAKAYCNAQSARDLASLGIEGRKWAQSKGLDKCRVIDTHSPG